MLKHISLRDFAVVHQAELRFGPGMTVVSGETGAGKSLLVDALLLLVGARADAGMVRMGAERAEVAAEFDLHDCPAASDWLREQELDDGMSCQLRRVLRADGGSKAWINGRAATLSQLAALGERLVEIHGQHEHQALLERASQLAMLDGFGGHTATVSAVAEAAADWRNLQREAASAGDDAESRLDWLGHQLSELDGETLEHEAIDALIAAHRLATNAEAMHQAALRSAGALNDDTGALAQLRQALQALSRWQSDLPAFAQAAEMLESARLLVQEASQLLDASVDELLADPTALAQQEARLSRLHDLARKHRVSLATLGERREALRTEHAELATMARRRAQLAPLLEASRARWADAATQLRDARKAAAHVLGERVTQLMQALGMGGGRFEVQLEPTEGNPSAQGSERVEFHVAANPGQPLRALRKVASGGELARIALAIEVAALGSDNTATMVFDEVDTGIGGAVAEVVGQLLRKLGAGRQVLCVTHLPQVAAQGHAHTVVRKQVRGEQTYSQPEALDGVGRVEEIARMLGGVEITDTTRANARQMLEQAAR